jgi:hypothetical protein
VSRSFSAKICGFEKRDIFSQSGNDQAGRKRDLYADGDYVRQASAQIGLIRLGMNVIVPV